MRQCARNECGRQAPWYGRQGGVSVDGRWYCSVACFELLARHRLLEARQASGGLPPAAHLRLGVWLRQFGITTAQVNAALVAQRETHLRLGAQLIALGFATSEMVLAALARQSGTDFIAHVDPATVRMAPAGLSPHAVRALCLVPFTRPERGHVRVACAGPLPRVALAAFARLTKLVPEPFLVTDDTFEALVTAYGADAEDSTAEFVEAQSLGEAVQQITAAAMHDGTARLTETRMAPLTWVRVHSGTGTRDVVLHESRSQREV